MSSWLAKLPVLLGVLTVVGVSHAEPPTTRTPWTTSRVHGSPEPPSPYATERAYPQLTFQQCLDVARLPGSERLVVVEQGGKLLSFPDRDDVERADLVVDLAAAIPGAKQVYALTFHPDFESNRYCYVCYIMAADREDGTHIARFRVNDTEPPTIDAASETTIITWWSGGHNGCCLKFGPDGCLYISTGDGVGPNPPDTRRTGQDLSDLLSSILRIDVDHAEEGRNYRIPVDNPFVNTPGARGEVWAYGFRNPWRMSFDRETGELWVGDVGWELWELLDRVERGGNYGWGVMEGRQPTNPEWPRGPTPILPPTIDHPHSESSSITDGLTYYGERLPELRGAHLYGDYDTGKLWAFHYRDGKVVGHRELADTTHRIVGFGEDTRGEPLIIDHTAGMLQRLIANPRRDEATPFPRRLSETGLFTGVDWAPAPGVVPYAIVAEPWADGAAAQRWLAVPPTSPLVGPVQTAPSDAASWKYPIDTVLAKTLTLPVPGAASPRRVETQLLHFDGEQWRPYTYRWNDEQTDATLVGAEGDERDVEIADAAAPGGSRRQVWRFAGRAECQRCHNNWSGPVLGVSTAQLAGAPGVDGATDGAALDDAAVEGTEIARLYAAGLLNRLPEPAKSPRLVAPRDGSASLEERARSYLHVNCAHCHRQHAGGAVLAKLHYDLPLERADLLGARPTQGTFGIHSALVVAPGDPARSVLWYRMAKLGGGRMPHLGSSETDVAGLALVHDWILSLPAEGLADSDPDAAGAARRRAQEAAELSRLRESAASGGAAPSPAALDSLQSLLATTSGSLALVRSLDAPWMKPGLRQQVVAEAARSQDVAVRDLYERFLPEDQRTRRLGNVVRPEQILTLVGDATRGRAVFFGAAGVQCKSCHRVGGEGGEVGPDLSTLGRTQDRRQILESLLEPSRRIDPKYVTYLAEAGEGRVVTGVLVSRDADTIVLRDAQNKTIRIASGDVERLVPHALSLMPDLQLRDLSAQQVADLLEFLSSPSSP